MDIKMGMTYLKYLSLAGIEETEKESLVGALVNYSKAAAMYPLDHYIYSDIGRVSEEIGDLSYAMRCYQLVIQSERVSQEYKQEVIEKRVKELEKKLESKLTDLEHGKKTISIPD